MAIADADHRRTRPTADASDSEAEPSLDDDEEYEEIEEEIEVEEEVEEEIEVDEEEDDESGQDLSPINVNHRKDISDNNKTEQQEEHLNSTTPTQENAMMVLPTDTYAKEGSKGPNVSDEMDISEDDESSINDVNPNHSELGKDVTVPEHYYFQASGALTGKATTKDPGDLHYNNNKSPQNGDGIMNLQPTNPLSKSGHEMTAAVSGRDDPRKEENKLTCLHYDEDIKYGVPRSDVPMVRPRSLSPGGEFKDGNKRPALICEFFLKGWCIKGKSCRFLHIKDNTIGEAAENQKPARRINEESEGCTKGYTSYSLERVASRELGPSPRWKSESQELNLYNDINRSMPSVKNLGTESVRESWCLHNDGMSDPPMRKDSVFLGTSSTSSKLSYFAAGSEEMAGKRSPFLLDDRRFRYGSWNLDPLGTQKGLDGERDFLRPHGNKTKISSYNWEPSKPFQPAFPITRSLLSSLNQYDPIHDSIETPKSGDKFSKFSPSSRGTFGTDYYFIKHSPAGHYHNIDDHLLDKKKNGKDLLSDESETSGTAIKAAQNRNPSLKEEKISRSADIRCITKGDTSNSDQNYATQTGRPRQMTESKVDRAGGQLSKMEVDLKIDEDMVKESKALRHFRFALIDFVKELVKPTWREGNLTKDAHKIIVKKSVDRFVSTLPANQIPSTPESIEPYLSSSQPKIAKFVEGYIEKYGKL